LDKIKKFFKKIFVGIYGIDNLYFVLFGIALILILINAFVRHFLLYIPIVIVLILMILRALSHNHTARKRENYLFFNFFRRSRSFFRLQLNRIRDRNTHIYKKCPKCHTVVRLPKVKGKRSAVCPKCQSQFVLK
jgi:uncharacterized paraquat-inducible protein A